MSYRHRVSCPVLGASRTTELSGFPRMMGSALVMEKVKVIQYGTERLD